MKDNKPNLFIVGAARAGTTTLYHILDTHPDFFVSPVKESNFFSQDIIPNRFSKKYNDSLGFNEKSYFENFPLQKRQIAFVREKENYIKLFTDAKKKSIIADFSTSYLYSDVAASNIYQYNQEAKIIILLRNPIERAFSHYKMALEMGFVKGCFLEEIDKDFRKLDKTWGVSELFIELGMYYKQVKRYKDIFPKNQIKVILFDDFINASQSTIISICDFLEIKKMNISTIPKMNTTLTPKNKKLHYIISTLRGKSLIQSIFPNKLINNMKKYYFNTSSIQISINEQRYMYDYFKLDIVKLEKLIRCDLSRWKVNKN